MKILNNNKKETKDVRKKNRMDKLNFLQKQTRENINENTKKIKNTTDPMEKLKIQEEIDEGRELLKKITKEKVDINKGRTKKAVKAAVLGSAVLAAFGIGVTVNDGKDNVNKNTTPYSQVRPDKSESKEEKDENEIANNESTNSSSNGKDKDNKAKSKNNSKGKIIEKGKIRDHIADKDKIDPTHEHDKENKKEVVGEDKSDYKEKDRYDDEIQSAQEDGKETIKLDDEDAVAVRGSEKDVSDEIKENMKEADRGNQMTDEDLHKMKENSVPQSEEYDLER